MSYASIAGRARTSSVNPQAHAICDRCGFRYNHVDLQFQFDWAGATVQNKRILVCRSCLDKMQSQLRAITLPGDPPPILNPRPELYATDATNFRVTSGMDTVNSKTGIPVPGGEFRITEDDSNRVTQQTWASARAARTGINSPDLGGGTAAQAFGQRQGDALGPLSGGA
jgi:hypothetical protein